MRFDPPITNLSVFRLPFPFEFNVPRRVGTCGSCGCLIAPLEVCGRSSDPLLPPRGEKFFPPPNSLDRYASISSVPRAESSPAPLLSLPVSEEVPRFGLQIFPFFLPSPSGMRLRYSRLAWLFIFPVSLVDGRFPGRSGPFPPLLFYRLTKGT